LRSKYCWPTDYNDHFYENVKKQWKSTQPCMQPYIYNSIEPVCKITLTALKQYHLFIFAVLVV